MSGEFEIFELSSGQATIEVSVIGYTSFSFPTELSEGVMNPLRFELEKTSVALKEVRVYSSLQKVNAGDLASSITVFNNELRARQGQHFEDLIGLVPNLSYVGGSSRPRYFQMRGEGSLSRYADQGPPSTYVGIVLDGMDLSELGMIIPLFDIEQVEVLSGVQTSLFGANASSGLISFKTKDPSFEEEGIRFIQYGNHNSLTLGRVYNFPLSEKIALRVAVHKNTSDGFKENQYKSKIYEDKFTNNKDETSIRFKLLYNISPSHTLKSTFVVSDFDNGYDAWAPDNNTENKTYTDNPGKDSQKSQLLVVDNFFELNKYNVSWNVGLSNHETLHSYDGDWGNNAFWASNPYNWDTSIEGYSYDFFDAFTRDISFYSSDLRVNSLESFSDIFSLVGGVFSSTYEEKIDASGWLYQGLATALEAEYNINVLSVYGEVAYSINNYSTLAFSLRSENREVKYSDLNDIAQRYTYNAENQPSYKLSYEQHFGENLHWFAYYASGYHPGGINQNPYLEETNREYKEENYADITTGLKWITDRSKLDISFFYVKHDDHILEVSEQVDPNNPNTFAFFKTNTDEGYIYGLESSGFFKLNDRLSLRSSLGLLSSEIHLGNHEDYENDQHGERAHAPNWNYSMALDYAIDSSANLTLELVGKDKFIFDINHDELKSDPYHLVNLYYSKSFNERATVGIYVKNIFDTVYPTRGFVFVLEPPTYEEKLYKSYGPPTEFGASLTYSF